MCSARDAAGLQKLKQELKKKGLWSWTYKLTADWELEHRICYCPVYLFHIKWDMHSAVFDGTSSEKFVLASAYAREFYSKWVESAKEEEEVEEKAPPFIPNSLRPRKGEGPYAYIDRRKSAFSECSTELIGSFIEDYNYWSK